MTIPLNIVKKCAKTVGFDLCGVVKASEVKEYDIFFMDWVKQGRNGDMAWADKNHNLRQNPKELHETTRSIIVVGLNYHKKDYSKNVSMLANGVDYHYVVKSMLLQFSELLETEIRGTFSYKICVDSAPITEKYWAHKAGLGWVGRNSLIINQEFGSFFVLGELLVDFETDSYDENEEIDRCAQCRRCEEACPTSALNNRVVDCRQCLAYLTIEHRSEFSEIELRKLKNSGTKSLFGCDICQNVCPWNVKALNNLLDSDFVSVESRFRVKEFTFDKDEFMKMSRNEFKQKYKHSSLFRTGLKKIIANINAIN